MTLPDERYRALAQMPQRLLSLLDPGRAPKSELRRAVLSLLRHYPTDYELEKIARKCPELLERR